MTTKKENQMQKLLTVAYLDYGKGLNTRAFFKVSDHSLGQDLVQNTFLKTWSYLVRGGKIETMKAFLYHILNNLIVDEYRKRKATSLDALIEDGFDVGSNDNERLFDKLDGKAVSTLIERLPEKYRNIMYMRYMQTLSLKEMSTITGQTPNNMAVQVHRGMEKLKSLYHPI